MTIVSDNDRYVMWNFTSILHIFLHSHAIIEFAVAANDPYAVLLQNFRALIMAKPPPQGSSSVYPVVFIQLRASRAAFDIWELER